MDATKFSLKGFMESAEPDRYGALTVKALAAELSRLANGARSIQQILRVDALHRFYGDPQLLDDNIESGLQDALNELLARLQEKTFVLMDRADPVKGPRQATKI